MLFVYNSPPPPPPPILVLACKRHEFMPKAYIWLVTVCTTKAKLYAGLQVLVF
jgi:hypothetical protein